MTEIEKKALALVNEVRAEHGGHPNGIIAKNTYAWDALCRAIEQHEAFRQEVSDAVESLCNTTFAYGRYIDMRDMLCRRFVIAKPDPLVETLKDMKADPTPYINSEIYAERLRKYLSKHGLKIVEDTDAPR